MGQAKQRGTYEERKALAVQERERREEQVRRRDAERAKIGGEVHRRLQNEIVVHKGAGKLGTGMTKNIASMLVAGGFAVLLADAAVGVGIETQEPRK